MDNKQVTKEMIDDFGKALYFQDSEVLLKQYQAIVEYAVAHNLMLDVLEESLKKMEDRDFIVMFEFLNEYFEM